MLLILFVLASFASVCAVLYTPALPDIAHYLKLNSAGASVSLYVFLIGYAIGNLPWGPLANRWGRKKTIIFGVFLTLLGSMITLSIRFYPHAWILNLGRFLTAIGSSVGFKMAFTLIGDLYDKKEAASKVGFLILSYAITPSLAIALGGYLTTYLGWYSCLIAPVIYSLFIGFFCLKLQNDTPLDQKASLNPFFILKKYSAELKNLSFLKSCFLMGCDTAVIYIFASLAPFIAMNEMGLCAKTYGLYSFIPPLGMILGFFLTQALSKNMQLLDQIKLGMKIAYAFMAFAVFFQLLGFKSPFLLFIPMPGILTGLSLVFTNASALAMQTSINKANGSAMANFIDVSLAAILLIFAQDIPYKASKVLPILFLMVAGLLYFLFISIKRDRLISRLLQTDKN